jgi:hypothetical protein
MRLNEEQLVTLSKLFCVMDSEGTMLKENRWLDGIEEGMEVSGRWVYKLGGRKITTICMSGWNRHPHNPNTNVGHAYYRLRGDRWAIEYHWTPETMRERNDGYPTPVIVQGNKKNLERDLLYAKMLFG